MKLKYMLVPALSALLIGFLMGKFMFSQYEIENVSLPVMSKLDGESASFLQVGVYSTIESMKKNLEGLENYIYMEEDGKYHAYVGITKNKKNIEKLKGYYQELGYVIYVKDIVIHSIEFLDQLSKYDTLLEQTEDINTIRVIISNVLTSYKELVIDGGDNQNTTKR